MRTILMGRKHDKEDWQLIAGPNVTTGDQIVIRDELNKKHPVNDTWAQVEIWMEYPLKGRLKFLSTAEAAEAAKAQKAGDAELENTRAQAEARQKKFDDEQTAAAKQKHDAEVAKLNKQHDALRAAHQPESRTARAIQRANTAAASTEETPTPRE